MSFLVRVLETPAYTFHLLRGLRCPCQRLGGGRNDFQDGAGAVVELYLVLFREPDGLGIRPAKPPSAEIAVADENGFPERLGSGQAKIFERIVNQFTNRSTQGVCRHERCAAKGGREAMPDHFDSDDS